MVAPDVALVRLAVALQTSAGGVGMSRNRFSWDELESVQLGLAHWRRWATWPYANAASLRMPGKLISTPSSGYGNRALRNAAAAAKFADCC